MPICPNVVLPFGDTVPGARPQTAAEFARLDQIALAVIRDRLEGELGNVDLNRELLLEHA